MTLVMNPFLFCSLCSRASLVSHDVYLINDVPPEPTWPMDVTLMTFIASCNRPRTPVRKGG